MAALPITPEPNELDTASEPETAADTMDVAPPAPVSMPAPPADWHTDPSPEEREHRFQAAQNGDKESLQHILWWMVAEPERGGRLMDLPTQTRRNLIEAYTDGRNLLVQKLTEQQCEMVRADLLSACGGSPLERLLIDRIVTCWLAAYVSEMAYVATGRYGSQDAEHALRRQDRAHRRLLQSVEALARLQRLMRPGPLVALAQVNIAQPGAQQVNVAAPTGAPSLLPQHAPVAATHPYTATALESPATAS